MSALNSLPRRIPLGLLIITLVPWLAFAQDPASEGWGVIEVPGAWEDQPAVGRRRGNLK